VRRQIDRCFDAPRDAAGQRAADALRRLKLHEDGRESLRQRVVDVARDSVALFEHGLPARFIAALFREPALMERESDLPRHGFEQGTAPRQPFGIPIGGRQYDPAEVVRRKFQRRDGHRFETDRGIEGAHFFRQPLVVSGVVDRVTPAGFVRQQMRGHLLARQRQRLPIGSVLCEELIVDQRHPQLAALACLVEKENSAGAAFAVLDERLHEAPEEPVEVGFAHEQIERELHGVTLDVRHTFGALAEVALLGKLGAERVHTHFLGRGGARFHVGIMRRLTISGIVRKS